MELQFTNLHFWGGGWFTNYKLPFWGNLWRHIQIEENNLVSLDPIGPNATLPSRAKFEFLMLHSGDPQRKITRESVIFSLSFLCRESEGKSPPNTYSPSQEIITAFIKNRGYNYHHHPGLWWPQ